MSNPLVIRADERGKTHKQWLTAYHTFSFGDYYHPKRVHFGVLRAINDQILEPSKGFTMHGHDNMEIVTLVLKGVLLSQDNLENSIKIRSGCIQVVSAGSGIYHNEYNASSKETAEFIQLLFLPKVRNVNPHYQLLCYELTTNTINWFITPKKHHETLTINQDVWLGLGKFTKGSKLPIELHQENHGLFIFMIDGSIQINDTILNKRDSIGLKSIDNDSILMLADSSVIFIEIPLEI